MFRSSRRNKELNLYFSLICKLHGRKSKTELEDHIFFNSSFWNKMGIDQSFWEKKGTDQYVGTMENVMAWDPN